MKHQLYILLFLVGGILAPFSLRAQAFNDTIDRTRDDFVEAYIVTASPGNVLYASFGHAMLHLKCPTFDLDYLFTYESESIQGHWAQFLKGDLKMGMFAVPVDTILTAYRTDGRGVTEFRLNLSPAQKQDLWRAMDELVLLGADRPYDYYNNGCAVSIVHVINQIIGDKHIQYNDYPAYLNGTLREIGYHCVTEGGFLWNRFALMTLAGSGIDNILPLEHRLIIPTDLVSVWQNATLDGHTLLDSVPHVLVESTTTKGHTIITPLLIAIVVLILSMISLCVIWMDNKGLATTATIIDYLLLTIQTLIGAVVCYTVFLSPLPCTDWNWLIIPFNILPALGWHWRKYWALPYAIVLMIWMIAMLVYPHRLVEPAHILLTLSFGIVLLKQYLQYR